MTYYTNKPYIFDFDKEYEYIGIGQISKESYKEACIPNRGGEKGKDAVGFSERYKVHLCFLNSGDTPDDQLIDAIRQTDFPSGQAALQMYMPLAPDSFVNIHKSRFNKQYYITSLINNPLCVFPEYKEGEDQKGCVPGSGFAVGLAQWQRVPSSNIAGAQVVNLNGAGADCKFSQSDNDFNKLNFNFAVPSACKPFDTNAINSSLINLKKDIEDLRNRLNGPKSSLTNAENFLNEAQAIISGTASTITGWVKWLIDQIKELTVRGINWVVNKSKALLYLNQRFQLQEKKSTAIDLILCLFNKILDNLTDLITKFLEAILNRYVNMATCAIEKFLTELVGQIIGQILSAVNGILSAVLGTISAVRGLIDSILDAVTSLLDFLTCEVKAECPDVTEWNFLEGAPSPKISLDVSKIINSAKSIISSATTIVDPNNFNFNLDINAMIVGVGDACNVGPTLCGPPNISFWGGGGQGATGNAIIGAAGNIIGIDIVSTGYGYSNAPFVSIQDSCGRGKGATAVAVVGDIPYVPPEGAATITDEMAPNPGDIVKGITNIIVIDDGTDYLPKPDGSKGGDGRVWADRCQSTIRRADGTWDYPYSPGEVMNIKTGDYVEFAGQPAFISAEDGSVTAPQCPPEDNPVKGPTSGDATYPIILELTDPQIIDPGFGYQDGDKIVVTPDNGTKLTPEFGYNGQLIGITVENTGIGFTAIPEIGIDSRTGYNAIIKPVFKVLKGDELITRRKPGVGILEVVDCVGKPQ